MLLATVGAMGLMAAAHPGNHNVSFVGRSLDDGRLLATPSPIPANGVYSVRGYGYNNREWISRGVTRDYSPRLDWGSPGPAHYGAHEDDFSRVFVRRGASMIVVSPWASLDSNGLKDAERARIQWLREYGYVGGVRTFRNHRAEATVQSSTEPAQLRPWIDFDPAATIRVPERLRRERPRFQVIRPVEAPDAVAQAEVPAVTGL